MTLKFSSIKTLVLLILPAALMTSCVRNGTFFDTDTGDPNRGVIVSIKDAASSPIQRARGVLPTIEEFVLLEVIRDASTESELNQSLTINLVNNSAEQIAEYNAANGTSLVELPAAAYTLLTDVTNLTFAPGEFNKQIVIRLDKDQLDLSEIYALGFSISGAPGARISSAGGEALFIVGVKNKYDAVYEITGTCVDANGLYTGDYGDPAFPRVYELSTAGPASVLFYDLSWNYPNYIVLSIATGGGANTGIRPFYTFDLGTDALIDLYNYNNGTPMSIQPGSMFNAGDRSMDIEWILGRWHVTEHYTFLQER